MSLYYLMDFSLYYHQKIHNLNNIITSLNKQIIQLQLQLQTEQMEKEWYKSNNIKTIKNEVFTQTPTIYLKESTCQTTVNNSNSNESSIILNTKTLSDISTNTDNFIVKDISTNTDCLVLYNKSTNTNNLSDNLTNNDDNNKTINDNENFIHQKQTKSHLQRGLTKI